MEQLAEQQAPSAYKPASKAAQGEGNGPGPSASARKLLKFSTPRDPAALAAFINLRVLNPEHEHWRRGVEAAVIYAREHGDLKVPFTYRVPGGGDQAVEAEGGRPRSPRSRSGSGSPTIGASTPAATWTPTASGSWRSWA
ncbi:hypothetical protein Srufu_078980 [Streptomyces libani subsp. rufus]|nr:hypothetical protein Srufu_078980 [Streptomyces libani subsp. rufus]